MQVGSSECSSSSSRCRNMSQLYTKICKRFFGSACILHLSFASEISVASFCLCCSPQIRVEMKNYFLQYLDSHALTLESFVAVNLVQLLCRTVKLAWFDADAAKAIVDDCKALMERGR